MQPNDGLLNYSLAIVAGGIRMVLQPTMAARESYVAVIIGGKWRGNVWLPAIGTASAVIPLAPGQTGVVFFVNMGAVNDPPSGAALAAAAAHEAAIQNRLKIQWTARPILTPSAGDVSLSGMTVTGAVRGLNLPAEKLTKTRSRLHYTVQAIPPTPPPTPTITSLNVVTGSDAGGTAVTITGTGFRYGAGVTFGGVAATGVTVLSSTSITCTTPAGTAGAKDVVVTNPDAQYATLPNAYTFIAAPAVTSLDPATGSTAGGTAILITGTGFVTGATVTIGGVAATGVSVVSSTSITCTTPAGTAGAVDVVVTNPDAQTSGISGNGLFTYVSPPAPTIASIDPTTGPMGGGTTVTITGTGFVTGATVLFSGFSNSYATDVVVISDTSITCTTPSGSPSGGPHNYYSVIVTNPDAQQGALVNGFEYV